MGSGNKHSKAFVSPAVPFILGGLLTLFYSAQRAGGYTWDGGGSSINWSDANNWSSNIVPVSSPDIALNFAGTTGLTTNPDITDPFLLNALTFDSTAGSFYLEINYSLDFRNSSIELAPVIDQNSASPINVGTTIKLTNTVTFGGSGSGAVGLYGSVSGVGGLIKNNGKSTLSLNPSSNDTISFLAVNAGTVKAGAGSTLTLTATGSTGFGGNSSLFVEGGAGFEMTDASLATVGTPQIHNNGHITLTEAGWTNSAATPGGANEIRVGYAGGVSQLTLNARASISAGALRLGNSSLTANPGHGALSMDDDSKVTTDTLILDDPTATISIADKSTFTTGAISELTAGTAVTVDGSSSLVIDGNNSSSSFGGRFVNSAARGAGTIVKSGTGTLTLTGDSTGFTGHFTLNGGNLGVGSDTALGGASIDAQGGAIFASGADRSPNNTINTSANQTLGLVTVPGDVHNLTLSQVISNGNVAVNAPGGVITLSGSAANTFAGLTSVTAGTLLLNKSDNVAAIGGDLSIGNATNPGVAGSAIVRLNHDQQFPSAANITLFADGLLDLNSQAAGISTLTMTGGELRLGSSAGAISLLGDVNTNAASTAALITAGPSQNLSTSGSHTFTIARGTATYDLDLRAGLTGGTLIKAGPGILRLTAQTNSGLSVNLSAGTIAVAGDAALGAGAITVAGGTLVADGGDRSIANSLNLTGSATLGSSIDGVPRSLSFKTPVSLAADTVLTVSNNATTLFSSTVSGAGGILKTGAGTLALSNTSNTFSGGVTLNDGALSLAADGSLGADNVVTLNGGQLQFTAAATTARTFNMSNAATIVPPAGATLTYSTGARVNGGFLAAGGTHAFTDGSAVNGATSALGSTLTTSGKVSFNNVTLRGTTTQTGGLLGVGNTVVSSAGTLTVGGTINTSGFENDGVMHISSGAAVANSGVALTLGGGSRTTIDAGGTLSTAVAVPLELNGALLVNNGIVSGVTNVHFNSVATGTGTFGVVNVLENGRFTPGASAAPVFSPAVVAAAQASFAVGSNLGIEIGGQTPGTGFDHVKISGQAILDGTLAITTTNNFAPAPLESFDVLAFGSHTGHFATYTGQEIPHGLAYAPIYSATDLKLIAAQPGDATLDGKVDFADLVTVAQNYGGTLTTDNWWSSGDFNLDGTVGFDDLVALAQNYGSSLGPAPASLPDGFAAEWATAQASVPEPATLGIVFAAMFMLSRRLRVRLD